MKNQQVNFRLEESTIKHLSRYKRGEFDRGELSEQIREDLAAHERQLQWAQNEMSGYVTPQEACAICDVLNGFWMVVGGHYTGLPQMIALDLSDGDALNGLGEKWGCDVKALVGKVAKLAPWQAYVLAHWARLFWSQDSTEDPSAVCGRIFRCRDRDTATE
jgi:hypothetical protein